MIERVLAGILLVVALSWAGLASGAAIADDAYIVPAQVSISPAVIEPGGRSTITFFPGFFAPDEIVETSVSGRYASAARLADSDGSPLLESDARGGLTVVFTSPQRGSGSYAVTFAATRSYTAIITVVPRGGIGSDASAHAPPAPDLGVPAQGDSAPGQNGVESGPVSDQPSATPADREGTVEIPGNAPEAPAWPQLAGVPWGILLLAAVALVACSVAATLLVVARRRG